MRKYSDDIEDEQVVSLAQFYLDEQEEASGFEPDEWNSYAFEVMQIVMLVVPARDYAVIDNLVTATLARKGRTWQFRDDLLVDVKDALLYGYMERLQDRAEGEVKFA